MTKSLFNSFTLIFMNSNATVLAAANFVKLFLANAYHGRGFIIGKSEDGRSLVIMYFMTGRSPESQNRRLSLNKDGNLETIVADPGKPAGNTELTLYPAIMQDNSYIVVSNGKQTPDVLRLIVDDYNFLASAEDDFEDKWSYEPDSSNTPRITGAIQISEGDFSFEISILLKSLFSDKAIHRVSKYPDVGNGFGFCVTTYTSPERSKNLPFTGSPYLVPLEGDAQAIAGTYWNVLPEDLRVSLSVTMIDLETLEASEPVIMNQYELVETV